MMPADEAAIRAAYRLKDRCYEARDLARLAATDLPTFYSVEPNGRHDTHAQIWTYLHWRMAHQVACHRRESPVRIVVHGDRARVEISTTDDFTLRLKKGLQRRIQRPHGWSEWVRTPSGWKQAVLRFDRS